MGENVIEELYAMDDSLYVRVLLGRARRYMFKARELELAPFGVSPEQAFILFILHNLDHKATLAELASLTERGINTTSFHMIRMVKEGLVKKTREDRKTTLLKFELTEKGIIIFNNSSKMESDRKIMSIFSNEERSQLISMLQRIINKAVQSLG